MTLFHTIAIFYHYYISLTIITFSTGLGEFKFDFNYNTPGLNNWTGDTLAYCGIWQLPKVAQQSLSPAYTGNGTWDSSTAKILHMDTCLLRTVLFVPKDFHISYSSYLYNTDRCLDPRDSTFHTGPNSIIERTPLYYGQFSSWPQRFPISYSSYLFNMETSL